MGVWGFFPSFFYFQTFMEITGNSQGSQVVAGHSEAWTALAAACAATKNFQVMRF